ncbi:hypothetical protein [Mesorhizobium sp. AR07]|nr:hypothetical protein [Mesorhizobium sp. AR07]
MAKPDPVQRAGRKHPLPYGNLLKGFASVAVSDFAPKSEHARWF